MQIVNEQAVMDHEIQVELLLKSMDAVEVCIRYALLYVGQEIVPAQALKLALDDISEARLEVQPQPVVTHT